MQFTIDKIPQNLQEFEELSKGERTPGKVCALFLCAADLFAKDKEAGTAAMNILKGPSPMTPYDIQFMRDRLSGKAYLPLAYFEGATPENGYTPNAPYVLNIKEDSQAQESGYLRLFLSTKGADSPRPIKLREKPSTGEWFLWDYTSTLVSIRAPKSADPWA